MNFTEKDDISDWDNLIEKQFIQYVDNSEIQSCVIAMDEKDLLKYKNDFCEICPAMMLGVMASTIPFCDHNQCIFYKEQVLMSNGTTKRICDVIVGDNVITFNPKTQKQTITKVVHTYTNKTEKQLYEITTSSGRKITATFDHQFMTHDGWMRLENLKVNKTLIAVSLEPKPQFYDELNCGSVFQNKNDRYKYSKYLHILSRIIGFTLHQKIEYNDEGNEFIIIDFKHENDIENFEYDIETMKIPINKLRFNDKRVMYEGELPRILKSLRDIDSDIKIPSWIKNGMNMIKREFLSAIDEETITDNIYEDLRDMYKELGIKFIYKFDKSVEQIENFINRFEYVNIRYNYIKQVEIGIEVEYFKYLLFTIGENDKYLPIDFESWKNKVKVSSITLFVPIYSIIKSKENMISDITVEAEENQSFICGDSFCVHNSPRNIYQCLSPDTKVLMSDGTRREIKDVKIGDNVITFDPKTLERSITKVVHQYVRPTENKIYKIKTENAKEIIATGNHNFMSNSGWISVDKMKVNETKIGLLTESGEESKYETRNGLRI